MITTILDRSRALHSCSLSLSICVTACDIISNGADYQATKFCTERVEGNKKASDRIVMTWLQDPSRSIPTPYKLGRVQAFLSHTPPWVGDLSLEEQQEHSTFRLLMLHTSVNWDQTRSCTGALMSSVSFNQM